MGLEDTSEAPLESAPVVPPPEPPPPPAVDADARAREAARGRARRAKAKAAALKAQGVTPPAELEAPASPGAVVRPGPTPERIAQLTKTIDKSLDDTSQAIAGAIQQLAKDNVTVPVDVARATCAALSDADTRGRLAEAWAPLIAELAPVDGPPSPYVSAVIGSLAFAISVTATTFAIRNSREAKPS